MECIDAAYAYLTRDCGIDPKQIIAYGRSIGSGPTVDLCARHVGGMIPQSPSRPRDPWSCLPRGARIIHFRLV